jgi:uncharacterized protein
VARLIAAVALALIPICVDLRLSAACVDLRLSAVDLRSSAAQKTLPPLTDTVNDFAGMVDPASKAELDRRIRALRHATGDVIVVATVPSYEGFLDIRELAVRLFENGGRGIGDKGKDNGLLIVVAEKERRAAIEVGYDIEGIITDGFAGETIRDVMIPAFRQGQYGRGLVATLARLSSRIAQARGVAIEGVPPPERTRRTRRSIPTGLLPILLILLFIFLSSRGQTRRRRNRWTRGPWSGWSGGVGPFGGGPFGGGFGGFGGGGFGGGSGGGGFGGFGGGRSGGGGAAGGW